MIIDIKTLRRSSSPKSVKLALSFMTTLLTLACWSLVFSIFANCKKEGSEGSGNTPGAQGDTIKIGEVGSMTGLEATYGQSTHDGIEMAINEANAAGGVKGKKLQIIKYDNQGKTDESATAITRLITQDKVIAVLGEVASSRTLAMAPIAQMNKIPLISPSSTNPKVTETGDYIFRVCFIDPFQGTVMARFATETLKLKKVAILRDVKNDYSIGLADYFAERFQKDGGEIVIDQSYSNGDMDFKSQLTSIRAKSPQAIFVPGYYSDVGLIARQAKELGLNVPLMGGDGWDSPKLTEIAGKAIDGSYFSNHYSFEDTAPQVQAFVQKFKQTYGVVPGGLTALAYDAARILVDAMKKAASLDPALIRAQLATEKDFQGVTGKITMDEKRNPVKSAVVLKVENGAYKYQTTINP